MSNPLNQDYSVLRHSVQLLRPVYINSDSMSDTKNMRSRHIKPNTPGGSTLSPAHFILSTGDLQSNEKDNDIRFIARNKHNNTQIIFMIVAALLYLLHTTRAYITATMQMNSHFWTRFANRPITRVYTLDLRPNLAIESLLFRLAENWQTFSLIYILTHIPRRTNFGYLYRNPNIFNSGFCSLLISALLFQTVSQWSPSPEISCACLYLSLILLIVSCRLVTVKLLKYENKYRSAGLSSDLMIIRYFILNSLFLYTTSIAYSTTCATVECIGIYLDPNATSPTTTSICTTIGLSIMFCLLLVYFLLDRFVYDNEFGSIWTPYLSIAYVFVCPPLRQLSLMETDVVSNNLNYYLFWGLFSVTVLIVCMRLYRQLFVKCRQTKK